ncbi:MAG: carbohydrate ABC transporter permease [Proteobacteria bacterium]|nr:carbohydrate ABC transporter permease [Pseudomonadota bacterium]
MPKALRQLLRAFAVLVVFCWSAGPILFVVSSSFKRQLDIFAYPPKVVFQPTFDHYVALWHQWDAFLPTLWNSVIASVGATVLAVGVSFLGGYVYSRYSGKLLAISAVYMIAIRLLPPIVVTLPLFPVVDYLGLSDTLTVLILLYASFWVSMCTMIIKTFIDEIPTELDEAAFVDGATHLQTITRVILPLSLQGMMAAAIFVFVYSWNEYLFALIFTTQNAKTAPLVISEVMDAIYGTDWGVLFAGVTIQLVPVVALVVLGQRLLVAGLTAGAVKG